MTGNMKIVQTFADSNTTHKKTELNERILIKPAFKSYGLIKHHETFNIFFLKNSCISK